MLAGSFFGELRDIVSESQLSVNRADSELYSSCLARQGSTGVFGFPGRPAPVNHR